jgi:hypothetical protein
VAGLLLYGLDTNAAQNPARVDFSIIFSMSVIDTRSPKQALFCVYFYSV